MRERRMRRRGLRKMRVWYAIFFRFIRELHPYKQVMEEPPVGYLSSIVISRCPIQPN
ncbi:MAG: hypothetical protein Q4P12_02630 [Bacteroidales bacterium]|nr:hypothetical protein [Bacteroidales bacterium]